MGFFNSLITTALCLTMAAAPIHQQQPAPGPTGAPQAGQITGTTDRTHTPRTSGTGRHGTSPHTVAALATKAQQTDATQKGNTVGPQDDGATCTPVARQTWGTPANDAAVNKVPDRDPNPVEWEISSDCTLTLHHGTSPDYKAANDSVPWEQYADAITKILIEGNVTLYRDAPLKSKSAGFFGKMKKLSEVQVNGTLHLAGAGANRLFLQDEVLTNFTDKGLTGLETSQATDMSEMFQDCWKLTSLDISNFVTSNVTNMSGMFGGCIALTSLNISNFVTSNVTNMSEMFQDCWKLTSLNISNFNTSNVTNMSEMFSGCSKLTSLNVSKFNTSKVTNMFFMFGYSTELTSLDLSNFDTSNVTNMSEMFNNCTKLTSLNISGFDTRKAIVSKEGGGGYRACWPLTRPYANCGSDPTPTWPRPTPTPTRLSIIYG